MALEVKEKPSLDLQNLYIAVVAIDFGTSYSGFAFSFNKGHEQDAIFMNRDWTNEQGGRTSKAPTCLLLNPDLSFNSFGYDAMENYAQLQNKHEEQKYFFLQHFKMALHSDEKLNKETTIKAANGKEVKAQTVFALSIEFMKDEAIKLLVLETGDNQFKADDIQWVLTVPAIWTPAAKQFMREAANQAGVGKETNPGQLIIALEPETAALFCMERKNIEREYDSDFEGAELSKPRTRYMVVDIGGGTLDVAVHEVVEKGSIKEIDKITGGPYGGIRVNQEFKRLLGDLFGEAKLNAYKEEFPSDWLALMNDFEGKKQGFRMEKGRMTNIRLPASFASLVEQNTVKERYDERDVRLRGNEYLCLSPNIMEVKLFAPVLSNIRDHLKRLQWRTRASNVKTLLLVGGFSDSPILQKEIKKEFSEDFRVLVPRNAAIAVVQGAVLFGKNPAKITERVMSTTYGADCSRDFDKNIHPASKRFLADGRPKCKNLFNCFVKEDDVARSGHTVKKMYSPLHAADTQLTFGFYVAKNPECKFITDEGVTKIGSVTVRSPDTSKGRSRNIEVSMHFGGTEIVATAIDVSSGSTAQTTLDFFHD